MGLRVLAGSLAFERGKGPIWDDASIRTTYIAKNNKIFTGRNN